MPRRWASSRHSARRACTSAGRDAAADDAAVPAAAKQAIALLGGEAERIGMRLRPIDTTLLRQRKGNAVSRRLAAVPGIGPLAAMNLALRVDASQFRSARHFAAWLGLVPRQCSTAGKTRLGGISRAGNERLRQLLVVGAMAVIRHVKPGRPAHRDGCWDCWSVGRASWWRWLWPTRWPGWCGPCCGGRDYRPRRRWAEPRRGVAGRELRQEMMSVGPTNGQAAGRLIGCKPCLCLAAVRGTHLGQRPRAAPQRPDT